MTAGRTIGPMLPAGRATVTGILAMSELRTGDLVAGRFRIDRLLGMGGMGVVYQAHDMELDVDVALKLLRPELASRPDAFERFRQELLLARQVSSPHVVRIHDLVRHGEVWLISMDFVAGESLEHLLDRSGVLDPEQAIGIVRQLALGLVAAHQRGVIHRDLKPANVLIAENGEARITDFGVARSAGSTGLTVSGVIIGTPEYLSPEQARADPVDGRSDLYALGLILFEMLTGTLPFRGGTPAEMLAQRIVRDPPGPETIRKDLPAFAVRLCHALLELKPARRIQSAELVVRAIDERKLRLNRPRVRIAALTMFVVALVTLAAGTAIWRQRSGAISAPVASPATLTIDVAAMPLVVVGDAAADGNLSDGLRLWLTQSLGDTPGASIEGVDRVDRALKELRFDGEAARRQRARVATTLGTRRLLEGDLTIDRAGSYTLKLSLWQPGATEPLWSASTPAVGADALPGALRTLSAALGSALGLPDGAAAAWPEAPTIRLIGRLQAKSGLQDLTSAALMDAGRKANLAPLWWSIEQAFDRSGRVVDATSAAREVLQTLGTDPRRAATRARAYALILLGDNDTALALLDALPADGAGDRDVRVLKARALGELGQYEKAHDLLETVVADDPRDVEAWFALGRDSIMAGDSKRAVDDYLVRAQVLANRLDDTRMQSNVTHALGIGYQNLGQISLAIEHFERAIVMRKALGDSRGVAVSLRNLSAVRAVQGDFRQAQAALDEARAILGPVGDRAALADLANDEGVLKEERGDYRGALESYRTALTTYQALENDRQVGGSLLNVGYAYYQVGEFDNAQVYWNQAASTYAKANDHAGIVRAKQNLGLAETARGNFALAAATLDASLQQAEEMQMAEERSVSLAGLADLARLRGDIAGSLRTSDAALALFLQSGDARGTVEMKLLRASALCDVGDWDGAAAAIGDLGNDAVSNAEQAAVLLWRQGEIALGRGDAATALARSTEAVAAAAQSHSEATGLSSHLLRARALNVLKRRTEAAAEIKAARQGLARYASVALRLQFAETSLRVGAAAGLPDYQGARGELARLPAYGRAFEIHSLAARAITNAADGSRDEALRSARTAYAQLMAQTPAPQQETLRTMATAYDASLDAAPPP